MKQVFPNYTNELKNNTGLDSSIEWHLESLSTTLMESHFIFSFNYLERIIYYHKKFMKYDTILTDEENIKFQKRIKASIKEILKELNIDSTKRGSIYSKTQELNRYTLWDSLLDFIKYYKIGYTDIFTNFGELKNMRDNIIHTGMPNKSYDEIKTGVDKITVFNQRIFLSLLKYEGNWINRLNEYKFEKFNSNPNKD